MTTSIVNTVPPAALPLPTAPLAEFVATAMAEASSLIGVPLGLASVKLAVDGRGRSTWVGVGDTGEILLMPRSDACQQFYQGGRNAFMLVSTAALGGMTKIPDAAWPAWLRRGGQAGLVWHMALAELFAVESLSDTWGDGFDGYRALMDKWLSERKSGPARQYQIARSLRDAVGRTDLYRLAHPQFVVDGSRVSVGAWLGTLPNATQSAVLRILERVASQPLPPAPVGGSQQTRSTDIATTTRDSVVTVSAGTILRVR